VILRFVRARAARVLLPTALAAGASSLAFGGCGTNVNLGGTADAGTFDAAPSPEELAELCEPCASALACPVSADCVQIAGTNTFCATTCPRGTECDVDDLCQLVVRAPDGDTVRACIPKAGACAVAKPPTPTTDSAPVVQCGKLDGPTVPAACKSCDKDDKDCQKNGCYGGWWCNTTTNRCQKPPASCP
jgi:hypothetical protein